MINRLTLAGLTADQRARLLQRTETDLTSYIEKVRPIIQAVKEEGDKALIRFARQFDHADISSSGLVARPEDFKRARKNLDTDIQEAISFAAANIRRFHEAQMPEKNWQVEISPGVIAGDRTTPIASLACYVPRGKGSFPSTVLMICIPAVVAGVREVCIVTPPGPDGEVDDATLVAAEAAGVSRLYKVGGAQAVAAVAYGTETVRPVLKFAGPGSPWVVAGQRLLSDLIATGTPAGPSESIIFADESAAPLLAASDLLIEAEHGADSSAFLVTTSPRLAKEAERLLPGLIVNLGEPRRSYVTAVLSSNRGGILLASDEREAFAFINDYAPEHLQILSENPQPYMEHVQNAGEILLGSFTPSTLANYVLGPSHVLPTGGWAKTHSALSVHDFLKRSSVVAVQPAAYEAVAKQARRFAHYEGFEAHEAALNNRVAK